jgi:hypothetical protein
VRALIALAALLSTAGAALAQDDPAERGIAGAQRFHASESATYWYAELRRSDGQLDPVVVAMHAIPPSAGVPGVERVEGAEPTVRYGPSLREEMGERVFPALWRARPQLRLEVVSALHYVVGQHLGDEARFAAFRAARATTLLHEQPLIETLWKRSESGRFIPFTDGRSDVVLRLGWSDVSVAAARERRAATRAGTYAAAPPANGIPYKELARAPLERVHEAAVAASRGHGIVVIAFAGAAGTRWLYDAAARHVQAGAKIRAFARVAPTTADAYDLYYDGTSLARSNAMPPPELATFDAKLAPMTQLQRLDLEIAAAEEKIRGIDKQVEAFDRASELAKDPHIND